LTLFDVGQLLPMAQFSKYTTGLRDISLTIPCIYYKSDNFHAEAQASFLLAIKGNLKSFL